MTWQEELRKLDEDFSSGNITADEYRVRRDQVLSSAVAPGSPNQPQAPSSADATQIVAPVQPPPGPPPQAPPPPEATQVVNPSAFGAPAELERTQAVRPDWQQGPGSGGFPVQGGGYPPQGPGSGGFPVQGGGYPPQGPGSGGFPAQGPGSGGFPAQPQPGWGEPQQEASSPWGESEFPPIAASTDSDWGVKQGPESFEDDSGGGGKGGKIVGIALAVVLLAGLAFGAWWLWGRGESTPTADDGPTTSAPQTPATTTPVQNESLPIAQLEGTPGEDVEITQFSDVSSLNYLVDNETTEYTDAGAGEANFRSVWLSGGNKSVILLTKATDEAAAQNAAQALGDTQVSNGAKKAADQTKGVQITEYTDEKSGLGQVRGHYSSGDVIVRIEVTNAGGLAAAQQAFKDVLNAQLDLLPADA